MTALLVSLALVPTTSTAYCLPGRMADGTHVRAGSIAHNGYRLGTRVTVWPSPTGRRRFVVRDRIGWGTELDFWLPTCARARAWGRRTVNVRVGWSSLRLRQRRIRGGVSARLVPAVAGAPRSHTRMFGESAHEHR